MSAPTYHRDGARIHLICSRVRVTLVAPLPGHMLLLLLLQMSVILAVSRLLGELFKRLDQPAVIGELLAGIVLGPSLFGWLLPDAFLALFPPIAAQSHLLEVVAWIGMVLLLLLTGFETDVRLLRHLGRAALSASLFGMVIPFAAGFVFAQYLPAAYLADPSQRQLFAAFFATAMSISAMPVIAKILFDLELTKRNIGVVILSAGVVDDTTGWVILSVIAGVAGPVGWSGLQLGKTVLFTGGFVVVAWFVALPAARWMFRIVDDRFRTRNTDLALIVILSFLAAAATESIGIHAVFGAFVAGCVIRQVPRIRPATMHRLEAVVVGVFAPIFFGLVGLKVDLHALEGPWVLLAVLGVATFGKVVGCTVGGLVGRLTFWESLSIGMGMNARGAMELVVALLGLTLGILNQEMYSIIVAIAVLTSFMAPPTLKLTMRRVPISDEERARLAADAAVGLFDPKRLKALLPTAGGPNALVAARLAAALVRGESATITALYIDQKRRGLWRLLTGWLRQDLAGRNLQEHLDGIRVLADLRKARLEVRRLDGADATAAIRREASRGFDLVLIGAGSRAHQALRGDLIAGLIDDAPCHVGIVRGGRLALDYRHVLVPFDGSYFARAAVETAVLYAEGSGSEVTVLYVMEEASSGGDGPDGALDENFRKLIATTMMATVSPVLTQTSARVSVLVREANQPTAPVLAEVATGHYDLVIVGAENRAVQHRLSVGYDVERIVEESPCTVMVVVPRIGGGGTGRES
ncbi:MAG: hypothetical protein EXR72_17610 [Myxococcales bacterium]|nr:hypothetical protein [Myxococcales bacterium]